VNGNVAAKVCSGGVGVRMWQVVQNGGIKCGTVRKPTANQVRNRAVGVGKR